MPLPDLSNVRLPSWAPPDLPEDQLTILRALQVVLDQEPEFILQLIPIFRRYCSDRIEFMKRLDEIVAYWERRRRAGTINLTDSNVEPAV